MLKTRLALRKTGEFRGIVDAVRKIYTREGLRSFGRGYMTNVIGIVPYAGIDLTVYEVWHTVACMLIEATLQTTLTACIFGMKRGIHSRANALESTRGLLHRLKVS